jgi:acetylglutamate kinase
MLAKLNSAQAALRQGVPQVRIAGGASSRILERILAGEDAGTRIAAGEVSSSAEVCSK